MIGLYQPGTSPLHRCGAGWKLLLLAVAVTGTLFIRQPWQLGVAVAAVMALYAVAGIGLPTALAQLRPIAWWLPFVAGFQLLTGTAERAAILTGVLVLAVALAALVTLTTRVSAILDLVQTAMRPFRRFGVDPDRIGLVLALTIRCVPLISGIVTQVWQARKARGVTGVRNALVSLAAPAVIRSLRAADNLGDALRARGVDD